MESVITIVVVVNIIMLAGAVVSSGVRLGRIETKLDRLMQDVERKVDKEVCKLMHRRGE